MNLLKTDSKWSLNFIEEFAITSLFKVSYAKFQTCSNSDRPPLCNDLVNFSHYFHFKLRAKPTPFRHKMHILKKCAMRIICSVILTKKPVYSYLHPQFSEKWICFQIQCLALLRKYHGHFGTANIINLLNVSQLVVQSNLTKTSLS